MSGSQERSLSKSLVEAVFMSVRHETRQRFNFVSASEEGRQVRSAIKDIMHILDRLEYTMETPDAALSFRNDVPVLIAVDDSGIDHEVMFALGRKGG